MSVNIIAALDETIPADFVWEVKDASPEVVQRVTAMIRDKIQRITSYIAFGRHPYVVPQALIDVINKGDEKIEFARSGLRPVTSTDAKAKYPGANWELLFTLIDKDNRQSHVVIAYLH